MKLIAMSIIVFLFLGLAHPALGDSNPDSENNPYFYLAENYSIEKCDLNKDSFTDIVIAKFNSGSNYNINSYVYWGSAAGYSNSNRTDLPTSGAMGASVSDLNKDGWPDIVFANCYDNVSGYINSYIYWGSSSGFLASNKTELPTMGARSVCTSDLNNDGWLEIIFGADDDPPLYEMKALIYWGSPSGYSATKITELPTSGAYGISVSDLNKDNYPDIVFTSYNDGDYFTSSFIYWGSSSGYSATNRTELPTSGCTGASVNDLNGDNYPEIIFANYTTGSSNSLNSFIYWGSPSGYSATNRTELPTFKARGVASSDLNNDGYIDIVFSCLYIYWGSSSGYSTSSRTTIDHSGGTTVSLVDINNDQYIDIVLSDYYNNATYVYWGSNSGYSTSNRTQLPSIGPWAGVAVMQSYFAPPPPEEELRPKLEALMKHVRGRMHNIERLLEQIQSNLPAEIPDEIQEKLDQVEELIKEAENSKSPSEANQLLNEAKDILNEIINNLK